MPKALIKGETHLSRKDKQALMELDFSQFNAVFREGYDRDYFRRGMDSLYALFAIGHIVYGATFGRLYFSSDDLEEKAESEGVPYFGEIDAAIFETYEMVPRWKRGLLFLLSPFWAVLILGVVTLPIHRALNWFSVGSPVQGVVGAVLLIFFYGFAWAWAYFHLIESEVMYKRDEKMAEEVARISDENGYESILLMCGGKHRPGIASYLEDQGWKVEQRTTDSPIGKLLLWKDRLIKAIFHPRRTMSRVKQKIR